MVDRAPTSTMLIAKRSMQRQIGAEAPAWAMEQLMQGRDTPHLRQLAGASGKENPFELEELLDRTLMELGFGLLSREQGVLAYSQELARDFLDSKIAAADLLAELEHLCVSNDYFKELYPFYMLRWAYDDLKEQNFSYYRSDANRENFDGILRTEVEKLLKCPR